MIALLRFEAFATIERNRSLKAVTCTLVAPIKGAFDESEGAEDGTTQEEK